MSFDFGRLDPSLIVAAYASLEGLVNKALEYDPASRNKLRALAGKTLLVRCTAPKLDTYICLQEDGLAFKSHCEQSVTTQIKGSALALAALAKSDASSLAGSNVEVMGSTSLLSELLAIAKQMDIDWEEPLSQVLGDVAGPKLAGLIRLGNSWLGQRQSTFESLLGQYLSEESQATPSAAEQQGFYQAVDQLRSDVDRVAAKLDKLKTKLTAESRA